MENLLESGSDSENEDNGFKINKSYAKSYEKYRMREEKKRLMDKYGESDSEDEYRSTKTLDKEWLRAFAVVRFNQPRLYSGEKLFNEEIKPVPKKFEEKKFTLKDQERKFVLEKGGVVSDDDDAESDDDKEKAGPSYFEEQEEIKQSLKKAIGEFDDNNDDDEDSLLEVKKKTAKEEKEEENDYLAWLKGEKQELEDKEASKELAPLKAYWSNPHLTHKEKVLRDYILNNGYMDQEEKYGDSSDSEYGDLADLSEDEEFLDKADDYERTYNFRHEEPGGCEIKSYPRVIENSVRVKAENKRAERRKRLAEKKLREKEERMEDMKMLQRLQKEEKKEKLQRLQELSENPDILEYLEKDFDPKEHDKLMKKHYDDNYYQNEEDEEKPVFEEDEEMGNMTFEDDIDNWWQDREKAQEEEDKEMPEDEEGQWEGEELYADDPGFVMDADYDPATAVSKKSKSEKRKAKKNKKVEKAHFDPTTKTFDEYLDEYLKDKINRLPFPYREVMPNDFGLSTEEILTAPDKELNAWVSVKRMGQYRTKDSEMYDLKKYQKKAKNQYKKYQTLPSLAQKQRTKEVSDIQRPKPPKKDKEKKEKQKGSRDDIIKKQTEDLTPSIRIKKKKNIETDKIAKVEISDSNKSSEPLKEIKKETGDVSNELNGDSACKSNKKKKKKKEERRECAIKEETDDAIPDLQSSDLKKKKKKQKKDVEISEGLINNTGDSVAESNKKKKKKKKKEQIHMNNENDSLTNSVENTVCNVRVLPKKGNQMASDDSISSKCLGNNEICDSSLTKNKNKKSKKRKHNDLETTEAGSVQEVTSKKKMKLIERDPSEEKLKEKPKKNIQFGKDGNNKAPEHKNKKYRKNFSNLRVDVSDSGDTRPAVTDKREVNRNLRLVMSKSRLSSYGLSKSKSKKKKQSEERT